jgi:hypothetical protein
MKTAAKIARFAGRLTLTVAVTAALCVAGVPAPVMLAAWYCGVLWTFGG